MRLHQLTITGFGPFAKTVVLDGDACSAAGLFGLAGPTGAGKSSVLDALCFALYGDVPGHRQGSRTLRSHHADPTTPSEVTVEVTIAGRRFRITRSPEWQRPKKRGTGTVKEPTHVAVAEFQGDDWVPVTSRVDEAATLMRQVVGLSREQFTKVVLLPQGDFAAFLQADEKERRALLDSLFGTSRFAHMAAWFAEKRRTLREEVGSTNAQLDQVVAAARQAVTQCNDARAAALLDCAEADSTVESGDGSAPMETAPEVMVRAWTAAVTSWQQEATGTMATAQKRAVAARHASGDLARRLDMSQRAGAAVERLVALADSADRMTAAQDQVRNHLAAAPLLAVVEATDAAQDRREATDAALRECLAAWQTPPDLVTDTLWASTDAELGSVMEDAQARPCSATALPTASAGADEAGSGDRDDPASGGGAASTGQGSEADGSVGDGNSDAAVFTQERTDEALAQRWRKRHQRLVGLVAETETAIDVERDATAAQAAAERADVTWQDAQQAQEDTATARKVAVASLAKAEKVAQEVAARAAGLPHAKTVHAHAEAVHTAAQKAATATERVADLTARHNQAQVAAQEATDRWGQVRARRLAGMAAELATELVAGEPCTVCGATNHPAPAQPAPDRFTQADEDDAETAAKKATDLRDGEAADLVKATATLDEARNASRGLTVEAARTALDIARTELDNCQAAAAQQPHTDQALTAAKTRLEAAVQSDIDAQKATTAAESHAKTTQAEAAKLAEQCRVACGSYPSVAARISTYQAAANTAGRICGVAYDAVAARRETQRTATELAARLTASAATASPFATAQDILRATLSEGTLTDLQHRIDEHTRQWHHARDVLGDTGHPDWVAAAPTVPPTSNSDAIATALQEVAAQVTERVTQLTAEASAAEATTQTAENAASATYVAHSALQNAAASLTGLVNRSDQLAAALGPSRESLALHDDLARCLEGTGGGNDLGMSLSSFVLAARLESVVDAANARLGTMTHQRYLLEHTDAKAKGARRAGLGLAIRDAWTGETRPPSSLSGGEMFVTSLALALGLADVVVAEAGGHHLDTLFIDEGFGSLDADTLDDVMGILDELRDSGRVVGVISHVADVKQRLGYVVTVKKTRTGSHLLSP